jgi:hypothetical protein
MRHFFLALTHNPVSLLGTAIALSSAVLMITLIIIESMGVGGSPYIGIISYLILPMFFVLGLLLIPYGIIRERRRSRQAEERGEAPPAFPVFDLNDPRTRRSFLIFLVITVFNIVILSTATYKGIHVMESNEFCGTTCHTVMQPEYTAYQRSPHSRVKCVECHIGPGADWFVKSKLSGAWQLVAVTFDLYPTPIPTPLENLRPSRETCEQCHWPTKFVGDKLKVKTHYAEDEENTELKSVILLKIGGIQGRESHGIHWHVDPEIQIRYLTDEKRETIYDVELTTPEETVTYLNGEPEEGEHTVWRTMDCVDCHNRPTHVYREPQQEVDLALLGGQIDKSLPYIRRQGSRALQADYSSHEDARASIAHQIGNFYEEEYPELVAARSDDIDAAGRVLGDLYTSNVFPKMNVNWGTYPNHIGHMNFPGCFRCHGGDHETEQGDMIPMDCDNCHTLLALEEEDPEILRELLP